MSARQATASTLSAEPSGLARSSWASGQHEAPSSDERSASERGLLALDQCLRDASGATGLLTVHCEADAVECVADHVERVLASRLSSGGVVRTSAGPAVDGWRDALCMLGSTARASARALASGARAAHHTTPSFHGARDLADQLVHSVARFGRNDLALIVADGNPSTFSLAVVRELIAALDESAGHSETKHPETKLPETQLPLVIWIRPAGAEHAGTRNFYIDKQFDSRALEAWWSAAAAGVARALESPHADGLLNASNSSWAEDAEALRATGPAIDALEFELRRFQTRLARLSTQQLPRAGVLKRDPSPAGAARTALPHDRSSETPNESAPEFEDAQFGSGQAVALQLALSGLALAGRPWPVAALGRLGISRQVASELVDQGLAVVSNGPVVSNALLKLRGGLPRTSATEADVTTCARIGSALEELFESDPWAQLRSAELRWAAEAHARALRSEQSPRIEQQLGDSDTAALAALSRVGDTDARADFWLRLRRARPWFSTAAHVDAGDAALVELALRLGDVDVALELARELGSIVRDHTVQLLLGRALAATGDLTAAALTLREIVSAVPRAATENLDDQTIELYARALVELAEVSYFSGSLGDAREHALRATELLQQREQRPRTAVGRESFQRSHIRLDARNVLGKLLLAEGDFGAAERHFAADACEASLYPPHQTHAGAFADIRAGEKLVSASEPAPWRVQPLVLQLRARVNRAISVMSLSRRTEAQVLLEEVLREGEISGELKAVGVSLINLAALAIFDHRYGDALELSERAVDVLRKIGDTVSLARCVANLAELRVKLGLLDEAAQAARFGARVFRGGAPGEQAAQLALVMARVALAKGDSAGAQHHVLAALSAMGATVYLDRDNQRHASGTSQEGTSRPTQSLGPVRERVAEALLLAARVALDDGDTARAQVLLERCAGERGPQRVQAEHAVLVAQLARAMGEPFELLATKALSAAREADDDELLRECHLLLSRAALLAASTEDDDLPGAGLAVQISTATHHLDAAMAIRDRVLEHLPESLRPAFLARRDIAELGREAAVLANEAARVSRLALAGGPVSARGPVSSSSMGSSSMGSSSMGPPSSQSSMLGGRPPASSGSAALSGPASASSSAQASARVIVGSDPSIRTLLAAIRKVGPADATVLIQGESGTGKELVAEALHAASNRRDGALVKVNCAALVETLLLSELFGHEKGAFTGAATRRRGRFEAAEGGTLFLDEIGDISSRTQVALLRVLQEKTFERVGGTSPIRANVRVVCATHRNLRALVARGEFREDLYYRLCGVTLEVPALRARLADLPLIADAILRRIADERQEAVKTLSPRAVAALKSHTWPGNIRELENGLRAATLFAESQVLEPEDFSDNVESLRHISSVSLISSPELSQIGSSQVERSGVESSGVESSGVGVGSLSFGPPSHRTLGTAHRTLGTAQAPSSTGPASEPSSISGADSQSGTEIARSVVSAVQPSMSEPQKVAGSIPAPADVAYAHVRAGLSLHDLKRVIERDCIARALSDSGGNITRAATLLGMKRPRLSQLVKQYGLGAGSDSNDGGEDLSCGEELDHG